MPEEATTEIRGEAETVKLAERLHFEIGEVPAVFSCDVGDRQRKARRNRSQQHLSRPGPGIVPIFFDRFIDFQLELSDLYVTPVPAVPTGGDASHADSTELGEHQSLHQTQDGSLSPNVAFTP